MMVSLAAPSSGASAGGPPCAVTTERSVHVEGGVERRKVLIFQAVDFTRQDGGVRYSTNMLQCLSSLKDLELVTVTCGPAYVERTNADLVRSFGFEHVFIDNGEDGPTQAAVLSATRQLNVLKRIAKEKYFFHIEPPRRRRERVDGALQRIIAEQKPDLVIVNGITSALHVPSVFKSGIKCCFISHNKEVQYYRMIKRESVPAELDAINGVFRWMNEHGNWMSELRFKRRVEQIIRGCLGMVVLTSGDFPDQMPATLIRAVIPPVLPREDCQWSYHATRKITFVGGMLVKGFVHFSNRRAIRWICEDLAPELLRMDSTVGMNIIGASREEVPLGWRLENISFMGRGTRADVVHQLLTADLFIAPIDTSFGAKVKLAECISFGTPFIATNEALSGLPFLHAVPKLSLEHPAESASLIVKYLNSPVELNELSESIVGQASHAIDEQERAWRSLMHQLLARERDSRY